MKGDVYVHFGYPKCFSTSLQRCFFSQHPQVFYGGVGNFGSNIEFYNKELNLFFESGLLYFNEYNFKKNKNNFKDTINNFLKDFRESDKSVACFSFEHLLFNFSPQSTDPWIRISRLNTVFPDRLNALFFIRNQWSFLISLYKEYINNGYQYPFIDFIDYVYKYQDRNFLSSLFYSEFIEGFYNNEIFERIFVGMYEKYINSPDFSLTINSDLSQFLKISNNLLPIENQNPSIADHRIFAHIKANLKVKFGYGSNHLDGFENHRRRVYFNEYLKLGLSEEQLFENVLIRREAMRLAESFESRPFVWEINKEKFYALDEMFSRSNLGLRKILDIADYDLFQEEYMKSKQKFVLV